MSWRLLWKLNFWHVSSINIGCLDAEFLSNWKCRFSLQSKTSIAFRKKEMYTESFSFKNCTRGRVKKYTLRKYHKEELSTNKRILQKSGNWNLGVVHALLSILSPNDCWKRHPWPFGDLNPCGLKFVLLGLNTVNTGDRII